MVSDNSQDDFVEIGRLLKPFGIKGELKVNFYIDDSSDLKNVKEFYVKDKRQPLGFRALKFSSLKFDENPEYAKIYFPEISDRSLAEIWRLVPIFVKKEHLDIPDDGSFFVRDLLGLEAWNDNEKFGEIVNLITVGGREIFIVKIQNNKTELAIPFDEYYVQKISLEEGKVFFLNISDLL